MTATSTGSSPTATASSSMSAAPPATSPHRYGGRSSRATGTAPSPAAPSHPPTATHTTSTTGATAAPPTSTTSNSDAGPTTENGTSKMPEDAPAADSAERPQTGDGRRWAVGIVARPEPCAVLSWRGSGRVPSSDQREKGTGAVATYVLVHGGWSGAHGFRAVRRPLHAAGHDVFTPSLTGIGERPRAHRTTRATPRLPRRLRTRRRRHLVECRGPRRQRGPRAWPGVARAAADPGVRRPRGSRVR